MATISNTPRPGYVWDSTDNVWYPIGVGAHQHTNAADTPAVMPYSTYAAAGKNKIINGDFGIWQRGTSFTHTSAAYTADRFQGYSDASQTYSRQTFTPGTAPASGYEGQYFWRGTKSATGTFVSLYQHIEDVRTFAGQTFTVSFWAKADSNQTVYIRPAQFFGSGGSAVFVLDAVTVNITTSWTRISATFNMPSIAGKTIGTNSSALIESYIVNNGAVTWDVWGMQVEAGSTVTAFQTATGNPASELAACQRYYTTSIPTGFSITDFSGMNPGSSSAIGWCSPGSTNDIFTTIQYPVPMRAAPTFNIYSAGNRTSGSIRDAVTGSDITVSNYSVQAGNNKGFNYMSGVSATTGRPYSFQWTASAEL